MKYVLRHGFGFLLLGFVISFSSCKKEEAKAPADNLVGTYSYEARVNSGFGSFTSGKFTVTKLSDTQVKIVLAPQTEPTDLLSGSPEFIYDIKGLDITQVPASDSIANPFLSLIVPTGAKRLYSRTSEGKISASYLVIDGRFANPNYDTINFSVIGVKDRSL